MNHELHHLDQTEEGETSPKLAEIPVDRFEAKEEKH